MVSLEHIIATLKEGSPAQKLQALQELEQWRDVATEPLIRAVLQADDQDIDGILQGFEYEAGEGQRSEPPFNQGVAPRRHQRIFGMTAVQLHLVT